MLIEFPGRKTRIHRLVVTTESGAEFVIEERGAGLRVSGGQRTQHCVPLGSVFVQWDGPKACEVRRLRGAKCPE